MASAERGGFLEGYKKLNYWTMAGGVGVAFLGAFFAPALIAPGLTLAAIDAAQIIAINSYQNRKKGSQMKTA